MVGWEMQYYAQWYILPAKMIDHSRLMVFYQLSAGVKYLAAFNEQMM